MALLSLFFLSLAFNTVSSARIAGFWLIGGSQYITMRQIMEELASKGHEVLYVLIHNCLNSKGTARISNTKEHASKGHEVLYASRVNSKHTAR